jgi:hypothetical protein
MGQNLNEVTGIAEQFDQVIFDYPESDKLKNDLTDLYPDKPSRVNSKLIRGLCEKFYIIPLHCRSVSGLHKP